ncbi:hypothetical protein BKM30_26335 [Pseudomonas syringae pv. syringae]|nr:hypothetical protein BKM30_26335 [Pseudomonas syringae pv. syringae]
MIHMESWDSIKARVEGSQGILTVNMIELRDAAGKEKIGPHVKTEITRILVGMGLGHIPTELPNYQNESVRLYKRGSPLGDLIEMVITPSESNDIKLKEQFKEESVDHALIIEKIRELVATD